MMQNDDNSDKISWWLLPPDYIRTRHPALQRLEDNPIFLLWARRRMRKNYWKRMYNRSFFIFIGLFVSICLVSPFNSPLLSIGSAMQKAVLLFGVVVLISAFVMVLVYQKCWRSHEVSRYFAGCDETLIKDLLVTPIETESVVYAGCIPLMCRAFILLMSILLPIIAIMGVTILSANINLSTASYIIILTLTILLVLAYLYHADAIAIQNRLNFVHNLAFTPAVKKVADVIQFRHLNKLWFFDFVKGWAYFVPWAVVYLFIILTYLKNDAKTRLSLLIIFVLLSLITWIFIGAFRKSIMIERLAKYYRLIMNSYKSSDP